MDSVTNKKEMYFVLCNGFFRGLSGATSLYSKTAIPSPAQTDVEPIRSPIEDPVEAMRSDWAAIGRDISVAMKKHAEAS
jgi:hypothetical protein